ncbi:T9SS type A sorting domain-containing protein [Chryseobacterium sp. cx-311]|uniref:reprolysin-like metallopeptidase n=1 Tax=Marnyiella aurantia TaxID=2758037 RepID=UPI001AE3D5D2|nr:zinc-dependent metalloprotease family protein [Marnyiella aurantia]MBP0613590.1 T9SS type A sorting domain-containing protein [Marnyiella aurantia]
MKKLFTFMVLLGLSSGTFAQWKKAPVKGDRVINAQTKEEFYVLDMQQIKSQLITAQESGNYAKPVVISIPVLGGKTERFNVYSAPVVVKELADQYGLGSYAGVGIDDPSKLIRFSVAGDDFQSSIESNGYYQFITPADKSKSLFRVHPKSGKSDGNFLCSTEEDPQVQKQMEQLYSTGKSFAHNPADFSKSSDKKYRTLRLALSVTAEYTAAFGGVPGALVQMNATVTRVNFVFEKDLALRMILQNFPSIIYTNPSTDPYSVPSVGTAQANAGNVLGWNVQLQQTLTAQVGSANYDIGHLFGHAGAGGNAGCIACICVNPVSALDRAKGSGYTSPGGGLPQGDTFDIDYVAHEMGHQLAATHTFTDQIQTPVSSLEPGSGSTIMGYAGITNQDVQSNSDPYFHAISIQQIQGNLISKTCDVETNITNNPPVIAALPSYTIPKGTAFVLTASATDPENNPMTYTWEQMDSGSTPTTSTNIGTLTNGPSFRSMPPTPSPTRYFPRLSSVLAGVLNNSNNLWEAVSQVARPQTFRVTVRDNHPISNQQQTQFAQQSVTVGDAGPFRVTSVSGYNNIAGPLTWDVATTNAAPYNVANVKIDYTTNNGTTWVTLLATTPNDGSENVVFTGVPTGTNVKVRVSAINNVFYAVGSLLVGPLAACDGTAPTGVSVSGVTGSGATVTWGAMNGATYEVRYRIVGSPTWTTVTTSNPTVTLSGLQQNSNYEVQVNATCSGTPGPYSASTTFATTVVNYCAAGSQNSNFEYISNVTLANVNNSSANSTYTNYTTNPALQVNLIKGNSYTLSVSKAWLDNNPDYDAVSAWIDFNMNGTFEQSEQVMTSLTSTLTPVTSTFTVPASAVENQPLRMRIINVYMSAANAGQPFNNPCQLNGFTGEVEDYNVVVTGSMATSEVQDSGVKIYPNPATDVLNITKVSDRAVYQIHNMAGQLVSGGQIKRNQVNVSGLAVGTYIITVTDGDLKMSTKFIKK